MSDSNGKFPAIWKRVNVDVPGFEKATVAYNVMASAGATLKLRRTLNADDAGDIVGEIKNWPEAAGDGPFADDCPLAVRTWCCINGPQQAQANWLLDPNASTA